MAWPVDQFQISFLDPEMTLVKYVTDAGCRKEQTVGCFLDLEKAFNSVWNNRFLLKFREVQLPDCDLLYLINIFLRKSR